MKTNIKLTTDLADTMRLHKTNMITVTITVDKDGSFGSFERVYHLEDEHDFKEIYDCEAIRELVEIVNK